MSHDAFEHSLIFLDSHETRWKIVLGAKAIVTGAVDIYGGDVFGGVCEMASGTNDVIDAASSGGTGC